MPFFWLLAFFILTPLAHAYPDQRLTPIQASVPQVAPLTSGVQYWQGIQNLPDVSVRFPDQRWWERYEDPQLTRLIERALQNNLDLRITALRIKAAEANAGIALAREFPTLTLNPSFNRQRNSATLTSPALSQFGLGGNQAAGSTTLGDAPTAQPGTIAATPAGGGGGNLFAPGRTINIYQVPLRLNYELDLLGRNWTAYKVEKLNIRLSQLDQRTITLSLVTDVASQYGIWQHASQQLVLNDQLQASLQQELTLTEARFNAGLSNQQPPLQLRQSLTQLQEQRPELEQAKQLAARQLGVLLGQPAPADLQPVGWPLAFPPLQTGVPSELLTHRPDIQLAETRMAQQGLNVRLAKKQFFPVVNLTGQFGFATTRLKDLFKWDSHLLSYGGNLSQDLFNGGAKVKNLRLQKTHLQEQVLTYQKTLLLAFQEVETTLANYKTALDTSQAVGQQTDTQAQQLALVKAREAQGLVPASEALPLARQQTQLVQRHLQAQLNRYQAELTLYKALGGGF
jgi:outer membrane protein, multidrug efflux system